MSSKIIQFVLLNLQNLPFSLHLQGIKQHYYLLLLLQHLTGHFTWYYRVLHTGLLEQQLFVMENATKNSFNFQFQFQIRILNSISN